MILRTILNHLQCNNKLPIKANLKKHSITISLYCNCLFYYNLTYLLQFHCSIYLLPTVVLQEHFLFVEKLQIILYTRTHALSSANITVFTEVEMSKVIREFLYGEPVIAFRALIARR